ncbi:cold-shock protein [Streptomyces sp. NPDC048258]|uniref:cold-shock protein n=1 Tax=Streptomyces sp. NPDC048258 TaxID=3365527 RepID=UPI00371AF811
MSSNVPAKVVERAMSRRLPMPFGVVQWFNANQGIGQIRPDGEEPEAWAWAEQQAVQGSEALDRGDLVRFDLARDSDGLWADNIRRLPRRRGPAAPTSTEDGGERASQARDCPTPPA